MRDIIRFNGPSRVRGQGMTEYIIIVALIAIAAIAVTSLFGTTVRSQIAGMAQEMGGTSAATQVSNANKAGVKAATVSNANQQVTLGNYNKAGTQAL